MDNSPADPPAPPTRARLGPFNAFTVAVAVVLVSAGGAFGWRVKTEAPTARPTPEAAAAALALEGVEGEEICAERGADGVRDTVLRGPDPNDTPDLADYLPKRSPIPGYAKLGSHPLDAASDAEFLPGAVDGHVATFRPEGEGGFDVHVYRFLTRRAAAESVAASVVRRVCEFGAKPMEARGRPGMVVLHERAGGDWSTAWWLTRSDVVVVRYLGWGDGRASLSNLAAIAGAAALY